MKTLFVVVGTMIGLGVGIGLFFGVTTLFYIAVAAAVVVGGLVGLAMYGAGVEAFVRRMGWYGKF